MKYTFHVQNFELFKTGVRLLYIFVKYTFHTQNLELFGTGVRVLYIFLNEPSVFVILYVFQQQKEFEQILTDFTIILAGELIIGSYKPCTHPHPPKERPQPSNRGKIRAFSSCKILLVLRFL